jgi:hypothetical protein
MSCPVDGNANRTRPGWSPVMFFSSTAATA